jgi:hypothetical protein
MPLFRLISTAAREAIAIEFYDDTCASALDIARRACLEEAELWQEGIYMFTLKKGDDRGDLWIIYRNARISEAPAVAA